MPAAGDLGEVKRDRLLGQIHALSKAYDGTGGNDFVGSSTRTAGKAKAPPPSIAFLLRHLQNKNDEGSRRAPQLVTTSAPTASAQIIFRSSLRVSRETKYIACRRVHAHTAEPVFLQLSSSKSESER